MTHRFFLKLWPEMRLGATVMTQKQNKHRANGKHLVLQKQRRPARFNQMLRSCWFVFFMLMELFTRDLFLLHKLWINNLIWRCWKDYVIVYGKKNDQKCGAAVIGSFTMTMPQPTWSGVCNSFWLKNHMTVIPHPPYSFIWPCAMRLFPAPLYERPDERETFCWRQWSEKENAGGLEHQHWRVPEMFSAVGKTLVQVYRVKRRVLWRRLEV